MIWSATVCNHFIHLTETFSSIFFYFRKKFYFFLKRINVTMTITIHLNPVAHFSIKKIFKKKKIWKHATITTKTWYVQSRVKPNEYWSSMAWNNFHHISIISPTFLLRIEWNEIPLQFYSLECIKLRLSINTVNVWCFMTRQASFVVMLRSNFFLYHLFSCRLLWFPSCSPFILYWDRSEDVDLFVFFFFSLR